MTDDSQTVAQDDVRRATVHVAGSPIDRERIYRFRYDVMVRELNLVPNGADFEHELVREPLDDHAQQLFVASGKRIVAALSVVCGNDMPWPPSSDLMENFGLRPFLDQVGNALSFSGKLTVAKNWRTTPVPALLTGATYKLVQNAGARFDFTDCTPSLVGLYEKLGYRRYKDAFNDASGALRVPLVLPLDDIEHLVRLNSPFARMAGNRGDGHKEVSWFHRTFPDAVTQMPNRLRDEQSFWGYLTERLHQSPLHGIGLFANMTYREAQGFLRDANVLFLKQGDYLSRSGDIGEEMYIVLSGRLFVHSGRDGPVVAKLRQGDLVGEIAYLTATPRTADIKVAEDAEVLALSQSVLRKAMGKSPELTAKVLFNLSLILCQRLRATTGMVGNGRGDVEYAVANDSRFVTAVN